LTEKNSMDKSELKNIPLRPFMAVIMAPVVVFALANALFLPIVGALDISRGGFLADMVASTNNPFIQDFILIIASVCCLPLSAAAVLVGPALTSFLLNLKYPMLTSRSRAIWGGVVFFSFYMIFQVIYRVFQLISMRLPIYFALMHLLGLFAPICLSSLAGIVLSCIVAAAGRFGALKHSNWRV